VVTLCARWYVSRAISQIRLPQDAVVGQQVVLVPERIHIHRCCRPRVAAYAGAFGELFFPTLLVFGLCSRLGAVGLSFVNAVVVISYTQVLLAAGSVAALGQHVLWGSILLSCVFMERGNCRLITS
jgi:putative oxidoreductase